MEQEQEQVCSGVLGGDSEDLVKVVVWGCFVFSFMATFNTTVEDYVGAVFYFDSDGFHESSAGCFAVPGIYVNVFAVEAVGAMIGISVALDFFSAVFTGEVFYSSLEFFFFRHDVDPFLCVVRV